VLTNRVETKTGGHASGKMLFTLIMIMLDGLNCR
jgi:hypothetical protein